jgi:hypothetical protein
MLNQAVQPSISFVIKMLGRGPVKGNLVGRMTLYVVVRPIIDLQ